jgi:4-hydroxy-tetrahydrodipicolinate synthase
MSGHRMRGVVAAIATPLGADGTPDHGRFVKLAGHLLDNGCDGLNVLGTTGEATSFSVEERVSVMRAVAQSGLDLGRMMVGTGAAALPDAVRLTREAAELGFAGALVLPPFYYKGIQAPEAGIVAVFRALGEATAASRLPLFLYNFPAMTGIAYTPSLVKALLEALPGRIAGLKDSSGDLGYAREIAALDPGLAVFPSSEAVLTQARAGAFAGCISATANLNADLCAAAFHHGDATAQAKANAVRSLFDGKPLVAGVKAVLAHIHSDPSLAAVRPPMLPATAAEAAALARGYEAARSAD